MRTIMLAVLILIAIPFAISAEIIYVPYDYATVDEAVAAADDGDTVVVPEDSYLDAYTYDDTDVQFVVDGTPPEGAVYDSSVHGPRDHMPATPVE